VRFVEEDECGAEKRLCILHLVAGMRARAILPNVIFSSSFSMISFLVATSDLQ